MVEKSGDPANELPRIDKEVRTSGGYVAVELPHPHARGRAHLGTTARGDAGDDVPLRPQVERSRVLGGIRHGHGHAPGDEAHPEAARGGAGLQPAPDAFSLLHVLPWLGTRIHARVSRPAQERGHRLQVARRGLYAGLRAGRVSRLLDLARRRRRDDAPREGGHRSTIGLREPTRIRARAGTGSSGSGSNPPRSPTSATSRGSAKGSPERSARGASGARRFSSPATASPSTTHVSAAGSRAATP